jgi:hypothetical protein
LSQLKDLTAIIIDRINDLKQQIVQRPFGAQQVMNTVRLDMQLEEWEARGMRGAFVTELARALAVRPERFEISDVYEADELKLSLFVDFTLAEP